MKVYSNTTAEIINYHLYNRMNSENVKAINKDVKNFKGIQLFIFLQNVINFI